jgi:hypothetical protein
MALEGTHIRFAVDMQAKYKVEELNKYLSGSIYPDSRYKTKVDREKTHPKLNDLILTSDFNKGWHSHLLYDTIQADLHKEMFPEIFSEHDGGYDQDVWIKITALKIVQDMDDIKKFDIANYVNSLDYVEAANGEDPASLREYNQLHQQLYSDPSNVGLKAYSIIWNVFNLTPEIIEKFKKQVLEYQKDTRLLRLIHQIYEESLKRAKN